MKLICLFTGCRWNKGTPLILLGGERIRWQQCERCGANRYWVEEVGNGQH